MDTLDRFVEKTRKTVKVIQKRKNWRRLRSVIAMFVVFVTAYSLVLPAVTLDQSVADDMPGLDLMTRYVLDCHAKPHVHNESCYEEHYIQDEYGNFTGHTEKVLVCGKADWLVHVHDDSCWQDGELVCPLPEIEPHEHKDECYRIERRQICTLEEHVHTNSCYNDVVVGSEWIAVCGYNDGEVISPAVYSDPVYDEEGNLISESELIQEETVHYHTDDCFQEIEKTEMQLVCGMEEHIHDDSCYAEERVLDCNRIDLHTHTEDCYEKGPNDESPLDMGYAWYEDHDGEWVLNGDPKHLICGKTELLQHWHTDACFHEEYVNDETSDYESDNMVIEEEVKEGEENTAGLQVFDASTETVAVKVVADADTFPEGTTLSVIDVDSFTAIESAEEAVEGTAVQTNAVDIFFTDASGSRIEPEKPIQIIMTPVDTAAPEEETKVEVVQIDAQGEAAVVEQTESTDTENKDAVAFEADTDVTASVYVLVYTVNIIVETEIDGETYTYSCDYSLIGGRSILLSELLAAACPDNEYLRVKNVSSIIPGKKQTEADNEAEAVGTEKLVDSSEDEDDLIENVTAIADGPTANTENNEENTILKISKNEETGDYEIAAQIAGEENISGRKEFITIEFNGGEIVELEMTISGIPSVDAGMAIISSADGSYLPEDTTGTAEELSAAASTDTVAIVESALESGTVMTEDTEKTAEASEEEAAIFEEEQISEDDISVDAEVSENIETTDVAAEQDNQEGETLSDDTVSDDSRTVTTNYKVFDIALNLIEEEQEAYVDGFHVDLTLPAEITGRDFHLYHIHDGQTEELQIEKTGKVLDDTGLEEVTGISFVTNSFSEFVLSYTVDFHWEVNGKMYEFSIPGGGFVSLEHLVEVLGVASADEGSENGIENAENVTENDNDFVGEVPGVDVISENGAAYEEAIKLNEIEISEATKKFVADVANVEFSSPELVWVGKANEATTVGGLKEANELEVQYSAELTEDQIAEINNSTVEAGDWVLISVLPFTSEESLTITMKNGDQFVVRMTDASKLVVNYDSLNAVIDANNGSAPFLLYATKSSVNYYLKNDGTTTTTPPNESTLNNYTWTVSISNRNNHQYYFQGRNGLYLNLNQNGLTSTSLGAVILTQDGTQFKMTTSSRSMGWDGNNNIFYKRDDINPAKFNLYYVDPSHSSGGSSGTPGIVLTDEERQDLETWKNTLAKFNTLTDYDKTAEVVGDGDNRMYKIDLSASSGIMDFYRDVDLGFVLDVSNSMKFPSSLKEIDNTQIMMTQNNLNNYYWNHQSDYNREGCFYIISDPAVTSTIYKVFYDGTWKYVDASEPSTTNKIYEITDSTVIGKDGYRKPYTLYYADDTKDRFTYLQESVDYSVETLHKIVKPTEGTDDETANVRIAYNFFCAKITKSETFKDLRDAANNNFTIPLSYSYTDSGTKQNEALYDGNNSISGLSANEFGWKNGSDQYVILVTDGAPNGPSMQDVRDAAQNLKNQYPNVKIITVGLSTKDVEGGSQMLYDIADDVDGDGQHEFYEAEKAKDLEYILLKILQSIMAKGIVKGTVTDTIDEAFYPVDSFGNPLSAGVYNASGLINGAQISDYVSGGKPTDTHNNDEFYTLEQVGDSWKITWYNQKIGWDDGFSETGNPWTGTVYIKAKEDYLGGNLIETNDGAMIEPTGLKLIIDHQEEPDWRDLDNMPQIGYPVPRVNVHNLETKNNDTTWTIYKGTSVTPKEQLKALWNNIPIEEVVNPSEGGQHKRTSGSSANVGSSGDGEIFTLGSIMSEVAPSFDIDSLIDQINESTASASQEFPYSAYGHESGKITVKVERTVGNQTPATHTANTVGTPVEQYKVTFTYTPYTEAERKAKLIDNDELDDDGKNDDNYHNGTAGRGAEETGTITSTNTHTINVFERKIQITKVDGNGNPIVGNPASFELYRVDAAGSAVTGLPSGTYSKVADLTTSTSTGKTEEVVLSNPTVNTDITAVKPYESSTKTFQKYYIDSTEYYILETVPPTNYLKFDQPVKVILGLEDKKTPVFTDDEGNVLLYNWDQEEMSTVSVDTSSNHVTVDDSGAPIKISIRNDKPTDLDIIKTDNASTPRQIGGAVFTLTKDHILMKSLTIVSKADGSAVAVDEETGKFTIPEGGITIRNLLAGEYVLSETEPPAGYLKTIRDVEFTIDNAGDIENEVISQNVGKVSFLNKEYKIQNEPGAALPNTGGPGTSMIYLLGMILTGLAGTGLLMKHRRRNAA